MNVLVVILALLMLCSFAEFSNANSQVEREATDAVKVAPFLEPSSEKRAASGVASSTKTKESISKAGTGSLEGKFLRMVPRDLQLKGGGGGKGKGRFGKDFGKGFGKRGPKGWPGYGGGGYYGYPGFYGGGGWYGGYYGYPGFYGGGGWYGGGYRPVTYGLGGYYWY